MRGIDVLGIIVAVGVGGAAAVVGVRLLGRGRSTWARAVVVGVAVAVGVLLTARSRGVFHTAGPDADAERLGDDPASREFAALYGRQLAEDPAWRDVLHGASGLADAQERVRRLTAAGVVRLDDAALRARAGVLRTILASDPVLCASIARGRATTAALSPSLMRLDPAARRIWFDVGAQAMHAELHRVPAPQPRTEDMAAAFQALAARLPPDQADRLRVATGHADGTADEDACWTIRTLYEGAAALPEAQGLIVLRVLAKTP